MAENGNYWLTGSCAAEVIKIQPGTYRAEHYIVHVSLNMPPLPVGLVASPTGSLVSIDSFRASGAGKECFPFTHKSSYMSDQQTFPLVT